MFSIKHTAPDTKLFCVDSPMQPVVVVCTGAESVAASSTPSVTVTSPGCSAQLRLSLSQAGLQLQKPIVMVS